LNTSLLKPQQKWIEYIGLFSILLFTISIFAGRDLNRIAEALFIISILFSLKSIYTYEKSNKGLWIYLLIVISFFFMLISNNIAIATYPALDLNHDQFSRRYLRILFFVFMGWWVIKQPKIIWLLLACFSAAFTVKVFASGDLLKISSLSNFVRLEFGFSNAQHTGAFAGSLLITCISLSPLILKIQSRYVKALAGALTLALLLIAFVVTLTSQTRAVWLGIFIVAGIALMPWAILLIGRESSHIKLKLTMLYATALAVLLIIASSSESISSKVNATVNHILHLSHLELKDIPTSSAGVRLHQWNLAINLVKKEPLLGYGGATKKHLIKISNMPKRAIGIFGHFHNSYLELGVAYGLGATFIFIFMLVFLLYRLIKAYKNNHISSEFALWGISWIIFFAIINSFESYVMYRTGYFLFIVFGGIIYGITSKPYIHKKNQEKTEGSYATKTA
jgi:O-antigen ligase